MSTLSQAQGEIGKLAPKAQQEQLGGAATTRAYQQLLALIKALRR